MPGIAGIISKSGQLDQESLVKTMTQSLAHEPFHTTGIYLNRQLGLGIGWACLKGSYADCLPIWNEKKDICLIFSGEHHGDPFEERSFKAQGHQFAEGTAESLVHLYEELGPAFVERLNGWFSGVVVDLRKSQAFLFNDRFGLDRLYFYEGKDRFYFASEAKCLLRVLPGLKQIDSRAIGEYLVCGCVLQNRTLFSGIGLLPGGSRWRFAPGCAAKKESYFRMATWENQPPLSAEGYYEKFKEIWAQILPRYLKGPQHVALSLTGGVDSRLILACAPCPSGSLSCYSFGGMYRDCADVSISRKIAQLCHQPHQTITLGTSFFSEFPSLAERTAYLSDGTMDCSGTADLFINRIAREIAPIRITGLNGGEILRRVIAFKPNAMHPELFAKEFLSYGENAAATYQAELNGNAQSFVAFKQAPWHLYPRLSIERSQIGIRSPYFDNDLVALTYQAPPECLGMEPALKLIAERAPLLRSVGTDRAIRLNPIPFCSWAHHQFQQFTFKAEYAYDLGMPHWLARIDTAIKPLKCERMFLGRHKFYHFRLWYRNELASYIKSVLLDPRAVSRPYLNGKKLEEVVLAHANGRGNYTGELHRLLSLELAQRQLLEAN